MELTTQRLPMPPTEAYLQQVVSLLLRLPKLTEVRVSVSGIEVKRTIEDEPVVPETIVELSRGLVPEEPELQLLLKNVELEVLPYAPDRHQLTALILMTEKVRQRGVYATAWYVTEGDGLDFFLAQPRGTVPAYLFGLPVHYVAEEQLPVGKLLLLGSTTRYTIDATYGVITDIGG